MGPATPSKQSLCFKGILARYLNVVVFDRCAICVGSYGYWRRMNKLLVIVLCFAIPLTAFAGDNGYKVTYDGGSIPDTKVFAQIASATVLVTTRMA